jgi:hypothetical protein
VALDTGDAELPRFIRPSKLTAIGMAFDGLVEATDGPISGPLPD